MPLAPPPPTTFAVSHTVRITLRVAMGMFVVAALTGVVFRFAVAYALGPGQLGGLLLGNVRHAHSHLMYFGWATPALMVLMAASLRERGDAPLPGLGAVLAAVFGAAAVAFPPFLLWGYGLASVGEARLPLAMMAAGLNVIGWYAFAASYLRARRQPTPGAARRAFDLAVAFLMLSTFGAWGLAALQPLGMATPARTATLVHVFLDTFSEGWFVLGVLGLAIAAAPPGDRPFPRTALAAMALGVPLVFPLALPTAYVPAGLRLAGAAGGLLVGMGLLAAVAWLWPRLRGPWRFALACLALKSAGQIMVALTPGVEWAALHGLRVLYLHLMLLGFVSVGLVAASGASERLARGFVGGVGVLLASLVLLTPLWPSALGGEWTYHAVAWAALPAVAVSALLAVALGKGKGP